MKSKQVSLVINPRAGQNLAKITDILAILAAAGWSVDLALKEYGGHTMKLATKAAEAGSDPVIAYGGDGTLNQVVNGVMHAGRQQSTVGLIPGGTANVWASEIGVPDDPVKATLTLVDSAARQVDIGHVEVEKLTFPDGSPVELPPRGKRSRENKTKATSKARQHFLLMAGLGIDGAVMGHVSRPLKYHIGSLATAISAAKELPAQRPFPVEVRTGDKNIPWKGEALQIVVGNTRLYADFAQMTPDASIDDGILDVCVITAGNPLTTMQQIVSLLLRRKPDTLTAEYFRGAHLSLSVPATIALQLDGSSAKLKDYLGKSERKALAQMNDPEQVMVTYRFNAIPRALPLMIPRTYDNTLFEAPESAHSQQAAMSQAPEKQEASEGIQQEKDELLQEQEQHQDPDQSSEQEQQENPEHIKRLLEQGRKVTVVGVTTNPAKPETYIIAGHTTKRRTGESRPVAICIDKRTIVKQQTGESITAGEVLNLHEGETIVVEGKKSKRGVIRAKSAVIGIH